MTSINEQTMHFNKSVKMNFEGGDLTTDAGLLMYKEFDDKIGLSQAINETVHIKDPKTHHTHQNNEMIMQKIYQQAAGYFADDHADDLKHDPAFTTVMDKEELGSQPTISRVNQKFDKYTVKELQQVNQTLTDRYYELKAPKVIILDVDSTNFPTYGSQYGGAFNFHYGENGYHPLLMFDGETGDCLKAALRAGNVYTSRQIVAFVGPELKRLRKKFPNIKIILRGDSGFAMPELYKICDEHDIDFAIRLKSNSRLQDIAEEFIDEYAEKNDIAKGHHVFYKECTYQAGTWNKSRKVVMKLEKPEGQLLFIPTFIVTTLENKPKHSVQFYAKRGTMENYIKEGKLGFAFGKMNSSEFEVNAAKLQIAVLAYNFHNGLRRFCVPTKMKKHQVQTIRFRLTKIAGKVSRSGRYIYFKLASSSLYKKEFLSTLKNIQGLPKLC